LRTGFEAEPGDVDEGRAEQRDEQPVAPCRLDAQDADAWRLREPDRQNGLSEGRLMAWMAWTWPTAIFFLVIAGLLILMTVLAIRFPETPRVGILRIETTRGDRLFITLLGSAFINIAWLGLEAGPQWGALIVSAVWAAFVFRFV
jgi:predicted small integral membrane protein